MGSFASIPFRFNEQKYTSLGRFVVEQGFHFSEEEGGPDVLSHIAANPCDANQVVGLHWLKELSLSLHEYMIAEVRCESCPSEHTFVRMDWLENFGETSSPTKGVKLRTRLAPTSRDLIARRDGVSASLAWTNHASAPPLHILVELRNIVSSAATSAAGGYTLADLNCYWFCQQIYHTIASQYKDGQEKLKLAGVRHYRPRKEKKRGWSLEPKLIVADKDIRAEFASLLEAEARRQGK